MKSIFLFLFASLAALEELPWIEPVLQPVLSFEGAYQSCHRSYYVGGELFFATSPDLAFQFEARLTKTNRHGLVIDQVGQEGRYVILDDARGDPFAVLAGIKLKEVTGVALRNKCFIHHGPFEVEFPVMLGKEWTCEGEWTGRLYGLVALGLAIESSPWLRAFLAADYRFCFQHILQAKLDFGYGFGNKNLCHFRGYGPIAYRLMDAIFEYKYGNFSIIYLKSLYRKNAPHIQQVAIRWDMPFSL